MSDGYGVDAATVFPMHDWTDADGRCDLCPAESKWKHDRQAHEYVYDPLEKVLASHQPLRISDDVVMCLCKDTFGGPVWHRRHVVGILRAVMEGRHDPFTQGPFSDVLAEVGNEIGATYEGGAVTADLSSVPWSDPEADPTADLRAAAARARRHHRRPDPWVLEVRAFVDVVAGPVLEASVAYTPAQLADLPRLDIFVRTAVLYLAARMTEAGADLRRCVWQCRPFGR